MAESAIKSVQQLVFPTHAHTLAECTSCVLLCASFHGLIISERSEYSIRKVFINNN